MTWSRSAPAPSRRKAGRLTDALPGQRNAGRVNPPLFTDLLHAYDRRSTFGNVSAAWILYLFFLLLECPRSRARCSSGGDLACRRTPAPLPLAPPARFVGDPELHPGSAACGIADRALVSSTISTKSLTRVGQVKERSAPPVYERPHTASRRHCGQRRTSTESGPSEPVGRYRRLLAMLDECGDHVRLHSPAAPKCIAVTPVDVTRCQDSAPASSSARDEGRRVSTTSSPNGARPCSSSEPRQRFGAWHPRRLESRQRSPVFAVSAPPNASRSIPSAWAALAIRPLLQAGLDHRLGSRRPLRRIGDWRLGCRRRR